MFESITKLINFLNSHLILRSVLAGLIAVIFVFYIVLSTFPQSTWPFFLPILTFFAIVVFLGTTLRTLIRAKFR